MYCVHRSNPFGRNRVQRFEKKKNNSTQNEFISKEIPSGVGEVKGVRMEIMAYSEPLKSWI